MANIVRPKNPYLKDLQEKPKWRIRWGILIFWLIVIMAGVYFFSYSSFFNISEIIVEGTETVGNDEIIEIAEEYKGDQDNLFKYPVSELEQEITDKFKQIDEVNVTRGVPKTIKIEIVERQGLLIWQTQEKNYIVDKRGVIYRETDDTFSLPVILDTQDKEVNLGDKILTTKFLDLISKINKNFTKKTKLKIKEMTIEDSTYELSVLTTNGWEIKLDSTRDANQQISALAKVLLHIRKKVKQYIDLRTENWVYYK